MPESMRIIICGAGIAGLCTGIGLSKLGHKVQILERAHALSPVGAGIHIPPNSTLVLDHFGVLDRFSDVASVPAGFTFRRYKDNSVLAASTPKRKNGMRTPYWTMKRSDYQKILAELAIEAGCEILLSHKINEIDEAVPLVKIEGGDDMKADLIIIADGMKSTLRKAVVPEEDVTPMQQPLSTYRAWASRESLMSNPRIADVLGNASSNIWIGPFRHMIIYPAENGEVFAINGTHPARHDPDSDWNTKASINEIQEQFHAFNPVLSEILEKAQDCKAWALAEVPRLPRWVSKSGKVVLIGDAAHGMLQFLAQGAAMATEDAGALTECMRRVMSVEDIPAAMRILERARKWRCEKVQAQARRNGEVNHMPDGEEQEHRDRKMAGEPCVDDLEVDCGPLLDEKFTGWLYSYNVVNETKKRLDAALL